MTANIPHIAYYLAVPVYLAMGFATGIFLRYRLARHLKVEHNLTARPSYNSGVDCWCREIRPEGDFTFAMPYIAWLIWPALVATMIISIPFKIYGKILRLVDRLAQHDKIEGVVGGAGCGQTNSPSYEGLQSVYLDALRKYHETLDVCELRGSKIESLEKELQLLQKSNKEYNEALKGLAQDNKRLEDALYKTTEPKPPTEARIAGIAVGSGNPSSKSLLDLALGRGPDLERPKSLLDPTVTVEEEFKRRTGRELGEDLKEPEKR